ncbi:hypothetical protein O181_115508 [Austropuccinia psidii MF-1]|uniref:Uncharacterized protein n=1 Tax=Austropuccinia psidii MF-1 TaxID=1389203 RepID=A0A9Q3PVL6_9BASI|nr:hypothetical protein [Austropuccinia psidii MF-1]
MGDAIRGKSDEEEDPREEFLVEYQEETPLQMQDIQLEAGMPQDTAKKTCAITHKMNKDSCLHQSTGWHTYMGRPQSRLGQKLSRKPLPKLGKPALAYQNKELQEFIRDHKMYGIDIYNSKNSHITIGTNNKKKFLLYIYQISAQDPLEELLNELREVQFSTTITSKQKLSLLKMKRKNRPEFAIGEEPLGMI